MIVYLMRGLPSTGKSTRARELVGSNGVICETDEYFYRCCGTHPDQYDYDEKQLEQARAWNLQRYRHALQDRKTPVIVDRGNGLNLATKRYVEVGQQHGYQLLLAEPLSPIWQELRILLKYREYIEPSLIERFAVRLADISKATHRVPLATILHWMRRWKSDLTIADIVQYSRGQHASDTS